MQVRARDFDSAYADVDGNGTYTAGAEPVLEYAAFRTRQVLTLYLPFGGDGDNGTLVTSGSARASVLLDAGVLDTPSAPGGYTATSRMTSVDPDNDSFDDGEDPSPHTRTDDLSVSIGDATLCATGPSARCRRAAKSILLVKDSENDKGDLVKWVWVKGDATDFPALGDPTNDTDYALCLYDMQEALGQAPTPVEIAPDALKWSTKEPKLAKYKDPDGTSGGVIKALVKTGDAGKAKVLVIAKGANLTLPTAADEDLRFEVGPSVFAQFYNSEGECWSAEFVDFKKNSPKKFIAK